MLQTSVLVLLAAQQAFGFPFVADVPGVDSSPFRNRNPYLERRSLPGSAAECPYNPNHEGARPITAKYPYCGAKNGLPGNQNCGVQVPAPGDKAHHFEPAGPLDIRGPCPGLNTAANHHFLSHDGITTFDELVDMQQNMYGVGYDLAVLLATLGVSLDGDPVTEKLSIGCNASNRTEASPSIFGPELGLDGHNKFEGDTSLTRDDYFLGHGDNFSFNRTLFNMMSAVAAANNSLFGRDTMALYRAQRYNQSRATNPHFYYGPRALLLYGAASFLYELFPSHGDAGAPSQAIENSFFIDERIPPNWFSRSTPYSINDVSNEINYQYSAYPVQFGGNAGAGQFVGAGQDGPAFSEGFFTGNASDVECLLYQIATENQPSSLQGQSQLKRARFVWAAGKLNPIYLAMGSACKLRYNQS